MVSNRQEIDLFIPELRPRLDYLAPRFIAAAALAIVVLTTLFSFVLKQSNSNLREVLADKQKAASSLEVQKQALQKTMPSGDIEVLENDVEKLRHKLANRREIFRLISGKNTGNIEGFSGQLEAISRHSNANIRLESFLILDQGAKIMMAGDAVNAALVPVYLENLRSEEAFSSTVFGAMKITRQPERSLVRFLLNEELDPSS